MAINDLINLISLVGRSLIRPNVELPASNEIVQQHYADILKRMKNISHLVLKPG